MRAPSINSSSGTIEGFIGGRSLVEMKDDLWSRGVASEVPLPTYGYMRKDEFYHVSKDDDLLNDWAAGALKGLIHTDRKGRNAGAESSICQIPWQNKPIICSRRWRMRYTRGVRFKERQWGHLAELQMDTISSQKDILIDQNRNERAERETKEFNLMLLAGINERWESSREEGDDTTKKPLVDYDEWRSIDGCLYKEESQEYARRRNECDENLTRWGNWRKQDTLEQWNRLR